MTAHPFLTTAQSGVYRTPVKADAISESLPPAGRWVEVDLSASRHKADVLAALGRALGLAETFGHNWDALADALQDRQALPADAYLVHLKDAARARSSLGDEWGTLLDILSQSAAWWQGRGKPFVVLVDGDSGLAPWNS